MAVARLDRDRVNISVAPAPPCGSAAFDLWVGVCFVKVIIPGEDVGGDRVEQFHAHTVPLGPSPVTRRMGYAPPGRRRRGRGPTGGALLYRSSAAARGGVGGD